MNSKESDNKLQAKLRTISLKDGFVDFSKFEIETYRGRICHKIARFGDEQPHQRKRPLSSGIKDAIYNKLENG